MLLKLFTGVTGLLCIFAVGNIHDVIAQDHVTVSPDIIPLSFEPIFQTPTSSYILSSIPSDALTAQQICHHQGGNLLSISSSSELKSLEKSLHFRNKDISLLWTSGIRYSNATVDNLVVWSSNLEPFPFPLANSDMDNDRNALVRERFTRRNRRSAADHKDCCPCPTTLPPITNPPCKRPDCTVTRERCSQIEPRQCIIPRAPQCTAHDKNCTVECPVKDCRIIEQPVCEVVESDKPRCRLEVPSLGCKIVKPQSCVVTSPGSCHSSDKPTCQPDPYPECKPILKPCKNPCSQQDCTTVQPPCTTTTPPCVTVTTPCPPNTNFISKCYEKCRATITDKEQRYLCDQLCNETATTPPNGCGDETTICPPSETTCPPPVTSCTRPFVDCSPIMCQSNVQLCPPPTVRCKPPQIFCNPPEIKCNEPEFECLEPEVVCYEPEIKCTKPKVQCPDPTVHCNPIVTSCDPASYVCTDPVMTCPDPVVECGEPVTCPMPDPPLTPPNCCGSGDCSRIRHQRSKRDVLQQGELEYVEKTECIALTAGKENTDWLVQSCNLKHRFICKI